MKKLRFQPTFASLTEAELEQLASDVQREKYDVVRVRICKPRSEGGLDLHFTSNSPLFRLREKKNRLDLINARITSGQKLTLAQLDTFIAGEHRAPSGLSGSDIHDAIMSATYFLVTEQDNTPHQLLALQRLADFPARSALRDQMAELREQAATDLSRLRNQSLAHRTERNQIARAREQRAIAREKRAAELHTLRLSRLNPTLNPNLLSSSESDLETLTPESTEANRKILIDEDGEPFTRIQSPCPLPDDVVIQNRSYAKKLLAGLIDPETGEELQDPITATNAAEVGAVSPSGPSSRDAIPSTTTTAANTKSSNLQSSSDSKSDIKNQKSEINVTLSTLNPQRSTFLSPEVLASNRLYGQKIDCGEIKLIFAPGQLARAEYCNPADQPFFARREKEGTAQYIPDPTRTTFLPALRTFGPNAYIPPQTQHSALRTWKTPSARTPTSHPPPLHPPTSSPCPLLPPR